MARIAAFLALNSKAKIYIRKEAFEEHYIKVLKLPFGVGLEKKLQSCSRIVFTDTYTRINDELALESNETIDEIAHALEQKKCNYYTCHCTGRKAYERMKGTLGDRLKYLSTGMEVVV